MTIEMASGERQMLDLAHLADRHIQPGWVRTIHSAQGATAERVVAHLESFRAHTVNNRSTYVAISRAKTSAAFYTDSRVDLLAALGARDSTQVGALDELPTRYGSEPALDGPGSHAAVLCGPYLAYLHQSKRSVSISSSDTSSDVHCSPAKSIGSSS